MSKYKITYFNATWLAEPIRFILSYKGKEFEDIRLTQEIFEAKKNEFPVEHVPLLEIDGQVLFQSTAICRHLANIFDLAGTNNNEKVKADIAVHTIIDLRGKINSLFTENDAVIRATKTNEILRGHGKLFLTYLNDEADKNNGFLAGNKLTWADLFFSAEYDIFVKYLGKNAFKKYPALIKLNQHVREIPNIKKWVNKRPESED